MGRPPRPRLKAYCPQTLMVGPRSLEKHYDDQRRGSGGLEGAPTACASAYSRSMASSGCMRAWILLEQACLEKKTDCMIANGCGCGRHGSAAGSGCEGCVGEGKQEVRMSKPWKTPK